MADEPLVLRSINWREAFPFTHIFRSFRIAIHPSKLVLAVVAILCLYLGGRVLDGLWMADARGIPDEVERFHQFMLARHGDWLTGSRDAAADLPRAALAMDGASFAEIVRQERARIVEQYASALRDLGVQSDPSRAREMARNGEGLAELRRKIIDQRRLRVERAVDDHKARVAATEQLPADQRPKALQSAQDARLAETQQAYADALRALEQAEQIRGKGLFGLFVDYQARQANAIASGVVEWNWLGGIGRDTRAPGVVVSTVRFLTVAPSWALRQHPLYFTLWGLLFLAVWSIFGGAISRICAVHVAREESMSLRVALRFSINKFLSFLFAPIIPLLILLFLGVILALGGLLLWVPYLGEIFVGLLFFLALCGGLVMTLVLLGTVGGLNLMYPTVAVEGSDSFDAISRSFSYVYTKPWRMAFYTAVALVHGALTWLFVRFFIWATLTMTHYFVGWWAYRRADDGQYILDALWPAPQFSSLPYGIAFPSLNWGQDIGAFFIALWVYLAIAVLGAFAISFYFSASTIIYYLMRKEVDATELDDVYLEQPEEELPQTPAVAEPAATPAPAAAPPAPQADPRPDTGSGI